MPDDTIKEIIYPLAEGTMFPKWRCVLRTCDSCPLYNICRYESNITSKAPRIKFHMYIEFLSCSVYGMLERGYLSCDVC